MIPFNERNNWKCNFKDKNGVILFTKELGWVTNMEAKIKAIDFIKNSNAVDGTLVKY